MSAGKAMILPPAEFRGERLRKRAPGTAAELVHGSNVLLVLDADTGSPVGMLEGEGAHQLASISGAIRVAALEGRTTIFLSARSCVWYWRSRTGKEDEAGEVEYRDRVASMVAALPGVTVYIESDFSPVPNVYMSGPTAVAA